MRPVRHAARRRCARVKHPRLRRIREPLCTSTHVHASTRARSVLACLRTRACGCAPSHGHCAGPARVGPHHTCGRKPGCKKTKRRSIKTKPSFPSIQRQNGSAANRPSRFLTCAHALGTHGTDARAPSHAGDMQCAFAIFSRSCAHTRPLSGTFQQEVLGLPAERAARPFLVQSRLRPHGSRAAPSRPG